MLRKVLCVALFFAVLMMAACDAPAAEYTDSQRLTLDEARNVIRDMLAVQKPELNHEWLSGLKETDLGIKDLFRQTGVQFYQVRDIDLYYIENAKAGELYNTGIFGAAAADVDGDRRQEAVLLFTNTSGVYSALVGVIDGGALCAKYVDGSFGGGAYSLIKEGGALAVVREAAKDSVVTPGKWRVRLKQGEIELTPVK